MLDNLSALVESTVGLSVCILALLVLGPLLSKRFSPKWRYYAWLLAALIPPIVSGLISVSRPALIQLPIPQVVEENAYDRYNARDWDNEHIMEAGGGGGATDMQGQWFRHYVRYENEAGQTVIIEDNDYVRKVTVGDETTYTVHWTGVAYGAYQAVSVLSVGFVLVRYFWSRRNLLRMSSPAGEGDQLALEAARRRTGCDREAELYRCSDIHTPLLMGFLHPVILLPDKMPEGSLEAALSHELTHLKRKDTGYMLILTVVRCVHWFNPLVWLMVRTARRDMELCCDYDLLNGQGEEVRRAYGRAILDQMTGRDRGFSGLTTGFSGSKKEVFARFRAIMDTDPKRKGRVVLVLAGAAVLLSGSLVGCQRLEEEPKTGASEAFTVQYAWVENVDRDNRSVTYIPMTLEQWEDREGFWAQMGGLKRETVPLTEDAEVYHTYEGERYPLNPTAQVYTLDMSQAGVPGQLALVETGKNAGSVSGIWLDAQSRLDLTAAGLDFTGYCGEVYAAGMGGAMLLHGVAGISVDPCNELGQDEDHTRYTLSLEENVNISGENRAFLTGLSSAVYPDFFRLTVVDGEVTAIEGLWPEAENTVTLPNDPEEETPSNPENMPEYDPDFYGENGAEDMPEYDPEFYGESGAQPLEPSGSGTA